MNRPSVALGTILLLATLAMGGSLANGWVHDDAPLIERNAEVHEWSGLWSGFVAPYWPPPSEGGLYRPLARSFHTVQWHFGGGSLLLFRGVDLLLYLLLVVALYALARELLTPRQALVGAAIFAVHPVHVEAVAVAVNQGELIVATVVVIAATAWARWRRGAITDRVALPLLAGLLLIGLGFKEHAVVLPLLLGAWELIVPGASTDRRRRWGALALLLVVAGAWWVLRSLVLGDAAGAAPVEGLRGVSVAARWLTMLGVAGEWTRLLLWPARLQGDYSPWEIAPWGGWASEQTAGLFAVLSLVLALGVAWRRSPPVALGLLWTALAILPVSNLLLPTGIFLAERTLLLPSVGVVLAAAALVPERIWDDLRWRVPFLAALSVVVMFGLFQSTSRMRVWRDRDSYLASLMRDAPESWRTKVAAGIAAMESGQRRDGETLLRAAHAAWPDSPRPLQVLAFYYRLDGMCGSAVPLLERSLRLRPDDRWTRVPLTACLLDLGRYADARMVAARDTAPDLNGRMLAHAIRVADSAEQAGALPGSVRLPPVPGGLTIVGRSRAP